MPKIDEQITQDGPIEDDKPQSEIAVLSPGLPKEFEWVVMDINNPDELKSIYDLLTNNYVEDDDAVFRFDYSAEFLKWALKPPGWVADWHIGVRVVANKKLVGFISGIPSDMQIHGV